jgi:deferrochelatase/peroxidase EfeB
MFKELTENLILIGHTKDKMINKNGEDLTEMSLDLVGKLGDIVCGEADAVGFMYRKGNQTIVNFTSGDDTTKGARASHLREQKIVLAESDENNHLTFHWDKIYLPNN